MVNPDWRNIRLPKEVLKKRIQTEKVEEEEEKSKWPEYLIRNTKPNEGMNFYSFDTQGCRKYNDEGIFYDDAIIEVHFPKHKFERIVRENNANFNSQRIDCPRSYTMPHEVMNFQHQSPVNAHGSRCCNIQNNNQRNVGIYQSSYNGEVCMNVRQNMVARHMPSMPSTSNAYQENIASQSKFVPMLSKAEKNRRKKQRQKANKRKKMQEQDEILVQCKLPKKLLAELIISSISME